MSEPTRHQVDAGHAFYTARSLKVYDLAILWYFSRLAWKCPAPVLLAHYNRHVSANHLDIGVGTGYFLDKCRFPMASPRLGLMDLNEHCLAAAVRRAERYAPEVYCANVLEPITIEAPGFDSIGMNYLLHCLPGRLAEKAVVFEHVKAVANPDAIVFGATLLHGGVPRNWLARKVMDRNNAHGIFSNADDDLDGLQSALSRHLSDPVVATVGCVALFAGRV